MTKAINRWQAAAADCYNLQLSRLTSSLGQLRAKVAGSDALKATGELDDGFQANWSEVTALKISAQMFGLNEHSSYMKLDRFLSELESTLQSEQAKRDFKQAKTRRIIAISVSAAVTLSSCVAISNFAENNSHKGDDLIGSLVVFLFLGGCFSLFIFFKWKGLFKGPTQKKLGTFTKEFTEYVKNLKVSADDIVLSRTKGDTEVTYTGFTATAA